MSVLNRWKQKRDNKRQSKEFMKLIISSKRMSLDDMYRGEVELAIEKNPNVFDKEYIKDVSSRYFELEKNFWSIWLVSFAIGAFLTSRLVGGTEVSVLGISIKSVGGIREPLVFLISVISILLSIQTHQLDRMRITMKVYATKFTLGESTDLYSIKYASILPLDLYFPKFTVNLVYGSVLKYLTIAFAISYIAIGFALMLLIGFIGAINAYDIYQNPSFYLYISHSVFYFYFISWLFGVLFVMMYKFPWKHKDYTITNELNDLMNIDKDAHDKRIKEISHQSFINAGLKSPYV